MYGDAVSYLLTIKRFWDVQDGQNVADLVCLRNVHVNNRYLQSPVSDLLIERTSVPAN